MSDFPGLTEPGSPIKSQKSDIRTGKFGKNSKLGGEVEMAEVREAVISKAETILPQTKKRGVP